MDHFESLFRKSLTPQQTSTEKQELMALIAAGHHDEQLLELLTTVMAEPGDELIVPDDTAAEILEAILHTKAKRRHNIRRMQRWAAAAAIVLLAGAAWWLLPRNAAHHKKELAQHTPITAPHNSAVLITGDGRRIVLDSLQPGAVDTAGTSFRLTTGSIAYHGSTAANTFNTLATPRGKTFQLRLPDGTVVWLNAASTLTYPTRFEGNSRIVQLEGEAYFDVAAMAGKPFAVKTAASEIKVLGTAFNVNAYTNNNKPITTLLHGAVNVVTGTEQALLHPGQQAQITGQHIRISAVDTSSAIAWKSGKFSFNAAGIQSVMNELQRWYDIDVTYENGIPDITFEGKLERNLPLEHVLHILEISNVHYRLEGRKLIITQ
ncbi:FecR family protein [Chitinophaga sp. sic0106]|uniref:FecR family protein n=1 Tax=Chitinophaga sp. sic0106 TaxID=2854785 RepID=UPI001C4945BD|nr:FecR family protein [Chitinophaga sp. sic0106]MBV7529748.1 FecR domain-containing protein [Chitinophaga sp. sic0106]